MLKKVLSQSSYWIINKELANKLGFEPTLLLTHLIECADMLDQPFYQQRDRILKTLGWTEYQYKKSVRVLKGKNLISSELKGIPPKNYWTINESNIYSLIGSNTPDKRVNITQPYMGDNHPTKKRNKKQEINTTIGEVEGGTPPDGESPTSSTPQSKKGGWERFVEMYPENKQNDLITASSVWNGLSQSEKQSVMRHSTIYLRETEAQFIKQIGRYLESDLWRKMKPKMTKEQRYNQSGYEVVDCSKSNDYNGVITEEEMLKRMGL